jgi:hypothetical protein
MVLMVVGTVIGFMSGEIRQKERVGEK